MPVYYISDLSDVGKNSSQIRVGNIAYIGLRDVDVAEARVLKENNMKIYTKEELIQRGE
jgi:arginase family enzyme